MSDPARTERAAQEADKIQRQLDEALAATFPASDPVALVTSHHEDWGHEPPAAPEAPPPKPKR
jgi:hypothetical protein